jgi:CRP-like cAMP-binding protein
LLNLLQHVRSASEVVAVPAGRELFREGDAADVMYVLMDGMADILVGGVQVELATPGTLFGEMALVDGSRRSATVVCRTPCRLVVLDKNQFDRLVSELPAFGRRVMSLMAERLRRMNERVSQGLTIQPAQRPNGDFCFSVYTRDSQGKRILVERFPTHELAVQKFPQATLMDRREPAANGIPST